MATETKTADHPAASPIEDERRTSSEIPIRRFYTPRDLEDVPYEEKVGDPGRYPYTRGIYPEMYRGALDDAPVRRVRLGRGVERALPLPPRAGARPGLSVAFDLPTQMGYDADHPLAQGEVGNVGVSIASIEDMRRLLRRHPARPGDHAR